MWPVNCASEWSRFAFRIRGATRCAIEITVGMARIPRFSKNSERRHHDRGRRLRRTFPILKFPSLQSPFDKDYRPFRHELFRNLRQLIPRDAANPFHVLVSILLIAEWLIDGKREIRDRLARTRGLHLGILPGIPEKNDFVYSDIRHGVLRPFAKNSER